MELIENGSLAHLMTNKKKEKKFFSDDEVSKIIKSLLSAISFIHEKNIVHRDIKPGHHLIFIPLEI